MGLLSNRISRESLKAGDHIYSWRTAYVYSHHGIYVGDNKVIHFTRGGRGEEVGTGTTLDFLLLSSGPARSEIPCPDCNQQEDDNGVVSSCLNCFVSGGVLYRFEYAVNPALFLAKARGGTCTLAVTDPDEIVVHRAIHLLNHGFGCYCVFKKNCEDFAIYCKTGLLVHDQGRLGQSGQAVSYIGGPLAVVLSTPLRLVTTNIFGMAATAVGVYCASRYAADIGMRSDVKKFEAVELTSGLERGTLLVVEEGSTALVVPSSTALEHFQWCLSLVQGRDTLVTFGRAVENTLKCSISDLQDPLLGETNVSKTAGLTAFVKSALTRWTTRAVIDIARMRAFGKTTPADHPRAVL